MSMPKLQGDDLNALMEMLDEPVLQENGEPMPDRPADFFGAEEQQQPSELWENSLLNEGDY